MSIIEKIKKESKNLYEEVKTERDDINVKLHLLSMDARDEWSGLEKKFERFRNKTSQVADVAEDSVEEVAEAIKLVGEELHKSYKRIRDAM